MKGENKRAPAAPTPSLKSRKWRSTNYIFFSEHILVLASHMPPAPTDVLCGEGGVLLDRFAEAGERYNEPVALKA